MLHFRLIAVILFVVAGSSPAFPKIIPESAIQSVVSVLPVWPNRPQGNGSGPRPNAPEGSGVVIDASGVIATAWHVIAPARRIDVRLYDGRVLPAELIGHDERSDIALLKIDGPLIPFDYADPPELSSDVCAVGNAFGLDLTVTCGVVSAINVANAGFNQVEDFIQTDAAANPGTSGGALIDGEGRLVGMVSAIFASGADTNIGINFAVSARLLERVARDLQASGSVEYVDAGWQLARLRGQMAARIAGALVQDVAAGGVAEESGILAGDVISRVNGRLIRRPQDVRSELAVIRRGETADVQIFRGGRRISASLSFGTGDESPDSDVPAPSDEGETQAERSTDPDCPHPEAVCTTRQAVFAVESFDPIASAVRIAPDLLITNRHVVGDRKTANVITPSGPIEAEVIASSYRGDLALLRVSGLPEDGVVLKPDTEQDYDYTSGTFYAVGADVARREIRVFEPGKTIIPPAEDVPFARHHVTSRMQPGVSGGALVNETGELVGIAVGGGEGRYEALPLPQVKRLLEGQDDTRATAIQADLGRFYVLCAAALDAARETPRGRPHDPGLVDAMRDTCLAAENPGQMIDAGRMLGIGRATDEAIRVHEAVVARTPNSINARLSLLVSLQLGGRFPEMLPHALWIMDILDDDPQALRFAIQSGVWGGDPDLAERAYSKLLEADPRQAQAARRFIDNAPPAPPRR
ncbi:MAG: trypsin-like peptidase domain-containing protein [Pseudomonadota bacterium]